MSNTTSIKKSPIVHRKPPTGAKCLSSTFPIIFGVLYLLVVSWVWGCSSAPEATGDPSKQEIQSDADRFFLKMEKEEAKKDAKDAQP